MKHKLFLSLLLALFPLFLLAQLPVTRSSTKPKAKPKTEQAAKPTPAKKQTNQSAKPNNGQRSKAASSSASNAKLNLKNLTSNMVYVSGGTFTMGMEAESDDKPAHSVTVSGFYICKYEVTQALWKAVMGSNPSNWKGDNLPVECVSWDDCQTFIRKLNVLTGKNFRLPTEAEWEFAARGGNKSRGYKYAGSNNIGDVAWFYGNSGKKTHVVGTKSPNELGIYDMSGNVWEWCQDWYGSYSSASQTNPTGASSGSYRVLRGGSWSFYAGCCRSSYRSHSAPDGRYNYRGLRLVLSQL